MKILKKRIILTLFTFLIVPLSFSFSSFSISSLKEKISSKNKDNNEKNENKKGNKEDKKVKKDKKVNIKFSDSLVDKMFYSFYEKDITKKIQVYEEYIKEKNKKKREQMEQKRKYLIKLNKNIKIIRQILKKNKFLYMGFLYVPKNSNMLFFQYNGEIYFMPLFQSKIKLGEKDINDNEKLSNYIPKKYQGLLNKYDTKGINKIKDEKEFNTINNSFSLIKFSNIQDNIKIFADNGSSIMLFPMDAFKIAVKEEYNIDYKKKGLYVFFMPNNLGDDVIYQTDNGNVSIKFLSDYFMSIGQNRIGINSYYNEIGYKEIPIPLYIKKQVRILKLKEKNPGVMDLMIFIMILLGGAIIIYIGLKRYFYMYNDIE